MFDAGVWYFVKNVQIFDDEKVKDVTSPFEEQIIDSKVVHSDHNEKQDECELKENVNQQLQMQQNNILNHLNDRSKHTAEEVNKH